MADLELFWRRRPKQAKAQEDAIGQSDPVIERVAAYPWPRGGVQARRVRGGYTLTSARTGAPVARLKPLPSSDRFEVLWWRRDAWGSAGPFGAVLPLNDALAFIADETAFWIRAQPHRPVIRAKSRPMDRVHIADNNKPS